MCRGNHVKMKRSQCYLGLTPSNSDGVVWRKRRRGGTEMRRRSGWTCALENGWEIGKGRNVTGGSLDLVRDMTITSFVLLLILTRIFLLIYVSILNKSY